MKKRSKIWFIVLLSGIVLFFITGCKAKEVVREKVEYKADSTAIWKLQMESNQLKLENSSLSLQLSISKNEVTRLNSEIFKLETVYDTSKPINPETGKPPVQSEITTITKNELEKTIKELELLNQESEKEIKVLDTRNINLELMVESLKEENRDLKSKTVPVFNLKSFLWGIPLGVLLTLIIILWLRNLRKGL